MPWQGVYKTDSKITCLQYNSLAKAGSDPIEGQEDCLFLNIYTPLLNKSANLTVIVYIHGGSFKIGAGHKFGPHYLIDYNIIFCSINYRLGILGFLSTEDDALPGNNGLWDQITALQFVKNHIQSFGGNPNSITIYGASAGGSSVHFHFLSKRSRGLFHKGFSLSGVILNNWALMKQPLRKSQKLAGNLNCSTINSIIMVECLRQKSGREIVQQLVAFQPYKNSPFAPFGPVVDSWARQPLLPKHPSKLIQGRKFADLPWLVSYTESEGLFPGASLYSNLEDLNDNWDKQAPHFLNFNFTVRSNSLDLISDKIRQEYFGNQDLTQATFTNLIQMLGDRLFVDGIFKSLNLQNPLMKSSIFMYYYTYQPSKSASDGWAKTTRRFGAAHMDDHIMMVKTHLGAPRSSEDYKVQKIMLNMLVTFAKTGLVFEQKKITTTYSSQNSEDHK